MKRLALVGYGRIAPKHLAVFRALGCDIVAACNRSKEGCEAARGEGGIEATFTDVVEMVEKAKPDGILCCASFMSMFHLAKQLIPTRIPLLLEKPPGISMGQYRELVRLAKISDCSVMVALNRRHYSVFQKAVKDAGGFERITTAAVEWSENPQYLLEKRGMSIEAVERFIFANSLHGIDLLTWLAGDVADLTISSRSLKSGAFRWLMAAHGVTDRGVLASFHSTWDSPGGWRVTFCSEGRRYVFAPLEQCEVTDRDGSTRQIVADAIDTQFKPGFYRQAESFLKLMDGSSDGDIVTLENVAPSMALAERLTNSLLTE